ncbi:MAG: phosphoribosylaminoimidazolesuccinocarboxamide synthase [Actinomycetota bacterium]|nr:phosphoribosylaminoimidazolesuccinocarboxamide synthase [Actinomycetota bacterium]MED5361501.1 phosphoribosylaminoimidazolesuccinocarboxamide synthase [Actinomycetota bacterium]
MNELQLLHSGKVREMYVVDERHLLMVATDRISAFDVVFDEPIPDKGRVLTAMTVWWSNYLGSTAGTHIVSADPSEFPEAARRPEWEGRALLVRRADMLPLECIVRGYITGSAWKEYRESGTMHGSSLPDGLLEAQQLPEPVFTPSTKATEGHDINISYEEAVDMVGPQLAMQARQISVDAYTRASEHAARNGVIIADTKFELGLVDGEMVIADEILTPDSSRFWPAENWDPGTTPVSLDKQPVRDATEATGWDKSPPPPPLSPETVDATRDRYITAYERITGESFGQWIGVL